MLNNNKGIWKFTLQLKAIWFDVYINNFWIYRYDWTFKFQWSITSKFCTIVYVFKLKNIWIELKVHLHEYNCHHNIV
jgi:hypothetical protein